MIWDIEKDDREDGLNGVLPSSIKTLLGVRMFHRCAVRIISDVGVQKSDTELSGRPFQLPFLLTIHKRGG